MCSISKAKKRQHIVNEIITKHVKNTRQKYGYFVRNVTEPDPFYTKGINQDIESLMKEGVDILSI